MKNVEILEYYPKLKGMVGYTTSFDFNMAVSENVYRMKKELDKIVEQQQKIAEPLKPYHEERAVILEKFSKKELTGETQYRMEQGADGIKQSYVLDETQAEEITAAMKALQAKHEKVLADNKENQIKYMEVFLQQENSGYTIERISKNILPKNIKIEDMIAIRPFLVEPEQPKKDKKK